MNRCHEYARELLELARGDAYVVQKGTKDPELQDWIVGFHAQQAIEKAIKAVITNKDADFPVTHDLTILSNLTSELDMRVPVDAKDLAKLAPFAVTRRYGASLPPPVPLDRAWALTCVERTLDWAARQVEKSG